MILKHIGNQILSVYGEGCESPVTVDEVARAIEYFLEERDCTFVDSKTLTFLAAQAMSSVGEPDAARRLILFGSGMVKPSEWLVTGDRAIWVLDLREMTVCEGAPLELLLFQSIQIVIESIADVWDVSQGDGVLGLRHICSAASRLLAAPTDASEVEQLIGEIKEWCGRKLNQLREERSWVCTPSVLNLDL